MASNNVFRRIIGLPWGCMASGIYANYDISNLEAINLISHPKQIADAFNDFFVNIGDTGPLNAHPIADFEQYMPAKPNCNLKFQSVTVE